jgi:hypothetical protein
VDVVCGCAECVWYVCGSGVWMCADVWNACDMWESGACGMCVDLVCGYVKRVCLGVECV